MVSILWRIWFKKWDDASLFLYCTLLFLGSWNEICMVRSTIISFITQDIRTSFGQSCSGNWYSWNTCTKHLTKCSFSEEVGRKRARQTNKKIAFWLTFFSNDFLALSERSQIHLYCLSTCCVSRNKLCFRPIWQHSPLLRSNLRIRWSLPNTSAQTSSTYELILVFRRSVRSRKSLLPTFCFLIHYQGYLRPSPSTPHHPTPSLTHLIHGWSTSIRGSMRPILNGQPQFVGGARFTIGRPRSMRGAQFTAADHIPISTHVLTPYCHPLELEQR